MMGAQNIKITTADGFVLDGVFTEIENSSQGIIFAHGMIVDKDDEGIFVRAESKLNEGGFSTLRFDFRGHGESEGDSAKDVTISGEIKDLEAAVSFMKERGIKKLGLGGASFGGGIAALFAGKNPDVVQSLFLANPLLDYEKDVFDPTTSWAKEFYANVFERIDRDGFIEMGSRKFRVGRSLFEEMREFNPCNVLKSYKGRIFIVHGDQDDKVAYQNVAACFERLTAEDKHFELLKEAHHGFRTEPYETQVVEMVVSFFTR